MEKIRSYLYVVIWFSTLSTISFARQSPEATIKGRVVTLDGEPAVGISISLKGTQRKATTNANGEYLLMKVKEGAYVISASSIGLKPEEKNIVLSSNQSYTVDFSLALSAEQLKEVVILSQRNKYKADQPSPSLRLDEPLLEAPQNIQVITSKTLGDQQVINMNDGVIRNVSGATRVEHWADLYARVNMRGSRAGAFRNGVNVTSDWGPLSEDMSFVDHIEFVKGPAGFMMSNGEPSGIYNVVTKKPTGKDFNGEASFTTGSFNLYRAAADLDGKIGKSGKLLFRLNLMGQNKKSFRPFEYNNRYVVAPVIAYKVDDQTTLTFEYTYQHAKMSDVGSAYSFAPNGYSGPPNDFTMLSPGIEPTNIDDHSAFVNLQHHFNANWKLTAQLAYFNYKQIGTDLWPDYVNEDGTMARGIGIWDAKSEYKYGQLFVNGNLTTGEVHHRILGGLDLGNKHYLADFNQYHVLDSAGAEFDPQNPYYGVPVNGFPVWDRDTPLSERDPDFTDQKYTGLYLQDELGFMDNRIRLTIAGRYTYVKQADSGDPYSNKHFTPRFGLSASIDRQTSVYALYDQSFVPQSGILRNGGNVKPITGNNMEVGIKKDWFEGKWSSTLTLYRILKNNALTGDPSNTGTEFYSVVLGQDRSQGIEFDLKGELLPGLDVIANYAYTDSKVKKVTEGVPEIQVGDRVPGYATHNVNTWFNYKLPQRILKGIGISAGFTYLADRDGFTWVGHDDVLGLPNYFRLDGGAFWEGSKLKFTLNVFNILNKYLYSGGIEDWTSPSYYSWQVEAPANYRFTVTYKF